MFFTLDQTNSGGFFTGPARFVIVEADTAAEANHRAKKVGIYFDGVQIGGDCRDCGDWWLRAKDEDGTVEPSVYSDPLADAWVSRDDGVRPRVLMVYADGRTATIDALPVATDRPDRSGPRLARRRRRRGLISKRWQNRTSMRLREVNADNCVGSPILGRVGTTRCAAALLSGQKMIREGKRDAVADETGAPGDRDLPRR